jgi:fluoride exporter
MERLLYIAAGGALGAVSRYLVSGWAQSLSSGVFPWGTLTVNALGSFLIGALSALFERQAVAPNVRLFLTIGALGGFTTFSSFSQETINLFREHQAPLAALNVILNNALGIALAVAGFLIVRMALSQAR